MANKNLTAEQIIARAEVEGITVYQIAKLINFKLTELGYQEVRPQMMYNYNKNGLINGTKDGEVTIEQALAFVDKFVGRRVQNPKYKIATEVETVKVESEVHEDQMMIEI
jgi:hypothetical protein